MEVGSETAQSSNVQWLGAVEWITVGHLGIISPGDSVAALPGIDKLSDSDLAALKRAADEIGVPVDSLATIMSIEGGFNPQAVNRDSGATGLIQFMPSTARMLDTTVEALRTMSFQQQLPYVVAFYEMVRCTGVQDVGELYVCTFCPALRGKSEDFVVARDGVDTKGACGRESAVYTQNRGLDINKDGVLTAGDVRGKARNRLARSTGRIPILDVPPAGVVTTQKSSNGLVWLIGGAVVGALAVATGVISI